MVISPSDVNYLRFILRAETDGILMARRRPPSLTPRVPELREIRALLRVLVDRGIEKIRLTGDDPALREDLPDVVGLVAGLDGVREVALTTRAVGLVGRVRQLAKRGLRTINVSIDTLHSDRYKALTGADHFKKAWTAVEEALAADLKVKLHVVLQRGINDDEIAEFVALTANRPVHVRILEWNSETESIAPPERFISIRDAMAAIKQPLIPGDALLLDGPAIVYEIPGHVGTVGFIPNVTEHLCSTCRRIGLTDEGEILSCIFGHGLSLIRHLRSPGGVTSVAAFVDRVLRRKVLLASKLGGFPALMSTTTPLASTIHMSN